LAVVLAALLALTLEHFLFARFEMRWPITASSCAPHHNISEGEVQESRQTKRAYLEVYRQLLVNHTFHYTVVWCYTCSGQ
jgi:hypothetical protein